LLQVAEPPFMPPPTGWLHARNGGAVTAALSMSNTHLA